MSYKRRDITVQITKADGTFDKDSDIITLRNFKCECSIAAFGGMASTSMDMSIYGLSVDLMSKLTGKTQQILKEKHDLIRIMVEGELLFIGKISHSRINLNQAPDAPIEISANAVGAERLTPIPDTSIKGPVKIASVVEAIAKSVGLKFVNVDVNIAAPTIYAPGNAIEQIQGLARHYGFVADMDLGTVVIYTGNKPVDEITPFVSPSNGLKGYPIFYDQGINFRTTFSTAIKVGRNLKLETSLPHASGTYKIREGTVHYLSSNMDGGLWDTFVVATPLSLLQGDNNVSN